MARWGASARGFSSVEYTAAAAILAAAVVPTLSLLNASSQVRALGEQRADIQQAARVALDSLARQLRLAGSDLARVIPQQANPVAIQEATSSALTFIGDIEGPGRPMKVRYRYDEAGHRIVRQAWRTWAGGAWTGSTGEVTVAEHVSRLTFTYFTGADQAPSLPADLAQVRRIVVDVTTSEFTPAGRSLYRVASDIRIRGLD
jgi:Tfp pilus assembly protein PilW